MSINSDVYDFEKGIDLAGGNRALALELINMLIAELAVKKFEVDEIIKNNDMVSLKQNIHKLHGSCQCCATPALLKKTQELESIIDNNLADQIETSKTALFVEIDRVLLLDTTTL